jgi:hypothetical protein
MEKLMPVGMFLILGMLISSLWDISATLNKIHDKLDIIRVTLINRG